MNPDRRPTILEPERVEWLPASPEAIEVRVTGTWHGATVPPPATLLVAGRRVTALPDGPEPERPAGWGASFLVPAQARAEIEAGEAAVEIGGVHVDLPPGVPGRLDPEPAGGTVIDPAVLAERRARRAELAEESATDRAATAEQTAETLRAQLGALEDRLAQAGEERDALASRVADAERQLRLAEQREEAERRRRGEVEEELAAARRTAEELVSELRARLAGAEEITEALERELERARRRQDGAEQAARAEREARVRVDTQLTEALARVEALQGTTGDEVERLRRHAAALEEQLAEVTRAPAPAPPDDSEDLAVARAEVAELQRRLAEVEDQLGRAEVARREAEARTAAAEALSHPGDPAREATLVAEVEALQAELARRASTQSRVQEAIAAIRTELAGVRAQVDAGRAGRPGLREDLEALEGRRVALEEALRSRDAELESARSALADAHAAAVAAQHSAEHERKRTSEAERSAAALRDRLAESEHTAALLRSRLHARTALEARLEELTAELADLRERYDRDIATERALRIEAERRLAGGPAPEAEAPAPAAEPEPEAEAEVPEPDLATGDAALDALITGLREQVATAREQLAAWDAERDEPAESEPAAEPEAEAPAAVGADEATRRRLEAIEADLRAAVPPDGASVPAREVIASLQDAAERLRAAAEEELGAADEEPVTAAAAAAAARPAEPLRSRPVAAARERAWLRTALERLADSDPDRAADLLVALLPAQALLAERLTYTLAAPALGTVRVALEPGSARIDRDPDTPEAEARLSGELRALAPLAAGGAGWRLPDVRIEGAKWRARRLVRARRRPVSLADLEAVAPSPEPGALLTGLAAAVEPSWTRGHTFGVSYVVGDLGRWTILAEDGGPLRVEPNGGRQAHAATIELSPDALLPVLLGRAAPEGERADVAGDRRAVDVLHGWFDRARGVAG